MKINYGSYFSMQSYGPYAPEKEHGLAGVSGGRTSGMMACLIDPSVTLVFDNTGLEHPATYVFLDKLQSALDREITWLEYRPPKIFGAPPVDSGYEVVSYETSSRRGEPFLAMLQALKDYRMVHKGEGPVSPWPKSRICTSHLKHKVHDRWFTRTRGVEDYESYVGIRYDEPERVVSLRKQETKTHSFRAPLYDAGLTEFDVLAFWGKQQFDLEIPSGLGNCTNCFLKDRGDIARNMGLPVEESHSDIWIFLEENYPMFGGKNFPGYKKLLSERPFREAAWSYFKSGGEKPVKPEMWTNRKYLSVLKDEEERAVNGPSKFSCACESSYLDGYADY